MKTWLWVLGVVVILLVPCNILQAHDGTLIAVSTRSIENSFQSGYMSGAETFAKSRDLISVVSTCMGDSKQQIKNIKTIIERTKGNVVFFVDPNDEQNTFLLAKLFDKKNVYWASLWNKPSDIKVWDYKNWVCHVEYDGITAGKFTAQKIIDAMDGQGDIFVLNGMAASTASLSRVGGFNDISRRYYKIRVVGRVFANWSRIVAYEKTKKALAEYPDIKGIWSANDVMALGALDAIREIGKIGEIMVTGVDGDYEMLEAIKSGEAVATVYNDAVYQAGIGLAIAYAAKMKEFEPHELPRRFRQFYAAGVNVDKSNVDGVINRYILNTPQHYFNDYFGAFVREMR